MPVAQHLAATTAPLQAFAVLPSARRGATANKQVSSMQLCCAMTTNLQGSHRSCRLERCKLHSSAGTLGFLHRPSNGWVVGRLYSS